jgi:tetratricopeptide (TPR) repeat protein
VPVYGVGCERGVHYYAMQFIEGSTLADLIAQQRGAPPTEPPEAGAGAAASETTVPPAAQATSTAPRVAAYFRRVAEWGIQAAEALDCAHALGVVHRDVKPANLLLDATGRLWVTDFGLAQVQSDPRLTQTGDLVGTLRYMSPEQALARRVVIDHRTDVYALGATLYELLTLEPAFGGTDWQELLRQIAFEEPRPPRRVNKRIPAVLETIVLKALEKNPAERYATAQEMADDLERFLEDKPIRARRTPLHVWLARWARRHRALVAAVAALLLTALVLGGVAVGWRLKQQDEARRAAADHLQQAEELQGQARWSEALESLGRAEERLAGEESSELKERAARLRDNIAWAAELDEARLQATATMRGYYDVPGADRAYKEAFARRGWDPLAGPPGQTAARARVSSVRGPLVAALDHWSYIRRIARDGSEDRLRVAAALADDDPWRQRLRDPALRHDRAALERLVAEAEAAIQPTASLLLLVEALKGAGGGAAAEQLLRRAQKRRPDDFWINLTLASLLTPDDDIQPGRSAEAVGFCQAALAGRPRSAVAHNALGNAWFAQRKYAEAESEYQEAVGLQPDFAVAHANLGGALTELGRLPEAEAACRRAIALQPDLAFAHDNLSIALRKQNKLAQAEQASRQAVALQPASAAFHYNLGSILADQHRDPDAVGEYQRAIDLKPNFPLAHGKLGIVLQRQRKLDEAVAAYQEAIKLQRDAAVPWSNLADIFRQQGKLAEAVAAYRKLTEIEPDNARAHQNLGNTLRQQRKLAEAAAAYRKAITLKPDPQVHFALGNVLQEQARLTEEVVAYQQALDMQSDFPEALCNLGLALRKQGRFAEALAALRRGHELGSRRPNWTAPTARWVRETERWVELDARLPKVLAGEVQPADVDEALMLAQVCQRPHRKLYAAAARLYAGAFAKQPTLADDLGKPYRYDAAGCAALAGCGQGEDAAQLDGTERARLRNQGLDWLRGYLAAWGKRLDKEPEVAWPTVQKVLRDCQQNDNFADVRGPEALARLPEAEQLAWLQLWANVAKTLARAEGKAAPGMNSTTK